MEKDKQIVKIDSLQTFISKFEEEQFSGNFYYRGEPKDYSNTLLGENGESFDTRNMASGYRWIYQNDKTFDDLLWLRNDYYREIGHTLTEKETENFIAYAQHHGLPTELLDITSNPAVALYFACEKDFTEDGYIYLFDNNGFNDKGMNVCKFYDNLYHNLVKPLISAKPEKQHIRFRWNKTINENHIQKNLMEKSNEFVYHLFQDSEPYRLIYDAFIEYQRLKKENRLLTMPIDKKTREIFEKGNNPIKVIKERMSDKSVEEELDFTLNFCINVSLDLIIRGNNEFFPDLKLLLHQPSIIFDRMRNQDGEFVYQLSYEWGKKTINQKVVPSFSFKIPSSKKEEILSQLDKIGINQKFIYPDHDNIAKYYADNYSKSFYKKMHPFG